MKIWSQKPIAGSAGLVSVRYVPGLDYMATIRGVLPSLRPSDLFVLNEEVFFAQAEPARWEESKAFYADISTRIATELPSLAYGWYGRCPSRNVHAWQRATNDYAIWQQMNDLMRPAASRVAYLCPSLYTFHTNIRDWQSFALHQLLEARRLANDKPIYPFLWQNFHGSMPAPFGKTRMPADLFAAQIRFCRQVCDGIALWATTITDDDWGATVSRALEIP